MKRWIAGALLGLAAPLWLCAQTGDVVTADLAKTSTALVLKIWNEGQLDAIGEAYDAEYVRHDVTSPQDIAGLDGVKNLLASNRVAFPDFMLSVGEQLLAGDRLVTRWTITGTNTGPIMSIPATGKRIEVSGLTLTRFRNGKIVEDWVYWNAVTVLNQLGFQIAPPAAAPAAAPAK